MAVNVADLIEPKGSILVSMFPSDKRESEAVATEDTLEARVKGYRDEGVSRVAAFKAANTGASPFDEDAAVTAWAYYRAFEARYFALNTNPANAAVTDQGSRGYLQNQIEAFGRRAANERAAFDAALNAALPQAATNRRDYGTVSVRTTFGL